MLGDVSKTLQIPRFLLPLAQNIVNTVVLGFRGEKKCIYFVLGESQKKRENITYLTISRAHQNATKRCVVKWLQAAVCKEDHIVPCARDEQCQHAHYQHNPYSLIALAVCEALQCIIYVFVIG